WCTLGEGTDLGAGRTGISLDGKDWVYRDHARTISIGADHAASAWGFDVNLAYQPEVDDRYELVTHTLMGPSGEVHVFWHRSPQPVFLHLGGYGIGAPAVAAFHPKTASNRLTLGTLRHHSPLRVL